MSGASGIGSGPLSRFDLDPARLKNDPDAMRKVAREMESLFAYEMIKAMKATSGLAGNGLGGESYLTLFQMELSKIMADRGLGLQDMLARGLTAVAEKAGDSGVTPQEGAATQAAGRYAAAADAAPSGRPVRKR